MAKKRTVLGYGLLIVATAVVATVAVLPASIGARIVGAAADGRVQITNTAGTLWQGRGDVLLALGGPPIALRDVAWSVNAARLLVGELCAELRLGAAASGAGELRGHATIAQGFAATELRDVDLSMPAEVIAPRIPLLAAWGVTGTVAIRAREANLSDTRINADGEITLTDVAAARLGRLGSYRATIAPAGERSAFKLATLSGPLAISGAGELGPHNDFRLNGSVSTDSANQQRLGPFLAMLGPRRPDGTIAIQWPLLGAPQPAAVRRGASVHPPRSRIYG